VNQKCNQRGKKKKCEEISSEKERSIRGRAKKNGEVEKLELK